LRLSARNVTLRTNLSNIAFPTLSSSATSDRMPPGGVVSQKIGDETCCAAAPTRLIPEAGPLAV